MSSDVSVPVLSKQHILTYRKCRKFNKNQRQHLIYDLYLTKKRKCNSKNINLQLPSQQMESKKVLCKKFLDVQVQSEKC